MILGHRPIDRRGGRLLPANDVELSHFAAFRKVLFCLTFNFSQSVFYLFFAKCFLFNLTDFACGFNI